MWCVCWWKQTKSYYLVEWQKWSCVYRWEDVVVRQNVYVIKFPNRLSSLRMAVPRPIFVFLKSQITSENKRNDYILRGCFFVHAQPKNMVRNVIFLWPFAKILCTQFKEHHSLTTLNCHYELPIHIKEVHKHSMILKTPNENEQRYCTHWAKKIEWKIALNLRWFSPSKLWFRDKTNVPKNIWILWENIAPKQEN